MTQPLEGHQSKVKAIASASLSSLLQANECNTVKLREHPKDSDTKHVWKQACGRVNSPGYSNNSEYDPYYKVKWTIRSQALNVLSTLSGERMSAVQRLDVGGCWNIVSFQCLRYSLSLLRKHELILRS